MPVLRARTSFHAAGRFVPAGEIVDADDPIVKGRAELFEPPVPRGAAPAVEAPVVEQATAAPGEKRSVGRPRKRA